MATKKRKARIQVSDSEIAGLAREAAIAGDLQMVKIAGKALSGNVSARRECERVISAARALTRFDDE